MKSPVCVWVEPPVFAASRLSHQFLFIEVFAAFGRPQALSRREGCLMATTKPRPSLHVNDTDLGQARPAPR